MLRIQLLALALASSFLSFPAQGQYADTVVSYVPGVGFSPGYTNPAAALGEPSRITPGTFGGPVDPFDPPYPRQPVGFDRRGRIAHREIRQAGDESPEKSIWHRFYYLRQLGFHYHECV